MLIRQEKKIERFSQLGTSTFRVKIEKLNHNHTLSRRCKYTHSYQRTGKMSRFLNYNYLRVITYVSRACIRYCTNYFHLRNIGLGSYTKIGKLPENLYQKISNHQEPKAQTKEVDINKSSVLTDIITRTNQRGIIGPKIFSNNKKGELILLKLLR